MKMLASNDPRHGTLNGYQNLMCRCPACRAANASAMRKYRAGPRAEELRAYNTANQRKWRRAQKDKVA